MNKWNIYSERRKRKPKLPLKITGFPTFRRRKLQIVVRILWKNFFSLHRTCSTFIIHHQRMDSSQNISESEHYNSCGWICTNRINVCISWCKYFNEFHVSIRGVSAIGMFRWICELQSFQMQSVRSFRRCKIREYSDNFGRDTRIILILIITMVIRDRWNNDVKHRLCSSTCKRIKFWIYWSIWEKY